MKEVLERLQIISDDTKQHKMSLDSLKKEKADILEKYVQRESEQKGNKSDESGLSKKKPRSIKDTNQIRSSEE
jgi:septum formation topological specificity factor MinE